MVTAKSKSSSKSFSNSFVSTFLLAENLSCYNQPIEFHQVCVIHNCWIDIDCCETNSHMTFYVRAWETSIGFSIITWELRRCLIVTRAWPTPRTGTSVSWTTWSRCWPGGWGPSPWQCTLLAPTWMTLWTPSSISGTAHTQILWGNTQHFMFSLTWVTYPPQFPDTVRFLKRLLFNSSVHIFWWIYSWCLQRINCEVPEGLDPNRTEATYRHRLGLDYPVNVARNVARLTAGTHFVFPSDIELYPR